jgi:hypothetical protein
MKNKLKRREDFHSLLDSISLDIESDDSKPSSRTGTPIKNILTKMTNFRPRRDDSNDSRQEDRAARPKLVTAPSLEVAEEGLSEAKATESDERDSDDDADDAEEEDDEDESEEDEEDDKAKTSDEEGEADKEEDEEQSDDDLDAPPYVVEDLLDNDEESRLYCRGNGSQRRQIKGKGTSKSTTKSKKPSKEHLESSEDDDDDEEAYSLDENELFGEKLYFKSAYASKQEYDEERRKLFEQDQQSGIDFRCASVGKSSAAITAASSTGRRRKGGVIRVFVILVVAIVVLRYVLLRNKRKQLVEAQEAIYA